ncbi:hypothetical protein FISHEDRAFT_67841 [Fistulina hepatica ATCC 64428]|nr:hypothetical protein FISHEDRAFT_67841 [Fistulina hepatica ATCC 64428]
MRRIIDQPRYLSIEKGGQRLREMYVDGSSSFHSQDLTWFGFCCYMGEFEKVKKEVESGEAPDLEGSETPYKFGYVMLTISGAQRVQPLRAEYASDLQHSATLDFLIAHGAPVDLEDIAGYTALFHVTMNHLAHIPLARKLIAAGADVNHRNRYGETALMGPFQNNIIPSIDLLMEHGASLDIVDADDIVPRTFQLRCGPQVTAAVQRWVRRRAGTEAAMEDKVCDHCKRPPPASASSSGKGGQSGSLRQCSSCHTVRYCSKECQRADWPRHKPLCKSFAAPGGTVTVRPYYREGHAFVQPMATLARQFFAIPQEATPETHHRHAHTPRAFQQDGAGASASKSIVVKVQVPFNLMTGGPAVGSTADLMVYTKKRDLVCSVRRQDDPAAYARITQVIHKYGVGGAKAYFAAELRSKDELVIKVSEVLAEQPF